MHPSFLDFPLIIIIITQVEDALRDRVDKFETKVGHNDDLMRISIQDDDNDKGESPKKKYRILYPNTMIIVKERKKKM